MQIYTYPKSRSLRVLWVLEELGISYETIKVDLLESNPAIKSPHPRGKVPHLIDGNISIGETLAICCYLCDKYSGTVLYPSDLKTRASINAWLSFSLTDLESPVWNLLKLMVFTPENKRPPDLYNYFKQEAEKAVSQVEIKEKHLWLTGDNFTLADVFMSHTLLWAKLCGISLDRNIDSYIDRAMSRPAFLKSQARNDGV